MSDPLSVTFGLLTVTDSPHASDVLAAALDSGEPLIQKPAALALASRANPGGVVELVRRLYDLAPAARATLVERRSALSQGLRQCLLHGDRLLQRNALELVLEFEDYEQVPTLVALLCNPDGTLHVEAAQALDELVDRLYGHCHAPKDQPLARIAARNPGQTRARVMAALEEACGSFTRLVLPAPVVQGILVLGDSDHAAVRKVLAHPAQECRDLAAQILRTSGHVGVMQLVVDSLSRNYPHPRAMDAIAARKDPEFLHHLLRWMPRRPTANQQRSLRQIAKLAWLDGETAALDALPPELQPALVHFVTSTGLPSEVKLSVQEWVVRHGTLEGRAAAAGVLESLDQSSVQGIIAEGLRSDAEDVQAWATSQLRHHGVPSAIAMLLDRLDSPLPAVRHAAQEELGSFDVYRLLELCDQLDPAVCRRAGELVRKTDPHCIARLEGELSHAVRRRRIRGARGARAMGLHVEIVPALLTMLEDDDPLVRRTAVEVLSDVPKAETLAALAAHLHDASARVRDAAARGVAELREALAAPGAK